MKRNLLKVFLSFVVISLVGCGALPKSAPKPPPIPECGLIYVQGREPYLKCHWSTDQSKTPEYWYIRAPKLQEGMHVCTTPDGYVDAYNYAQEVARWAKKNCE